ncbi:MAG: 16S rRNA (guanine(966)-N(2))-methyltransferase RsmD [Acidimicrobiia bacterium]
MRVIAGTAKGRRLQGPKDADTRPMTDRAKEALFSSLGGAVEGARVLDLFAGSGSLGIEALSRGAVSVIFVERHRRALQALRRNLAATGLEGSVVAEEAGHYLRRADGGVDLAFVDPPYALSLASVEEILQNLSPLLAEGAQVIVHRRAGQPAPQAPDLRLTDRRRYGDSELWRYQREGP